MAIFTSTVCVSVWMSFTTWTFCTCALNVSQNEWQFVYVCTCSISIEAGQEISKTWRGPIQPWVFHIDLRSTGGQKNTRSVPSRWKHRHNTHTYAPGEQSPSTMSSLNCCEIQIHPQQTLLHRDLFYLMVMLADFSLHINNRKWLSE